MKTLQQLQQEFLNAIIHIDNVSTAFITRIEDSDSLSAQQRLSIYRNNFIQCLTRSLQNIYPVCQQLVGEEFFRGMVKKYIAQTPSHSPDLGDYGESLVEFIAAFPPTQTLPYLSDVARLEWAWYRVLHGANNVRNNFQVLQNIPEQLQGKIKFQLPVNCFLLSSAFPIHRIWKIHQPDYQGEFTVDFNQEIENLMVFKLNFLPMIIVLSEQEWQFLQMIKQGKELENFSEEEVELLPSMIAKGLLGGITAPQFKE